MPSNTDPKTILLAGSPIAYERTSASGSAITPGQLIEVTSSGEVQEHSTAAGTEAQRAFARVEDYAGGSIDDDYAVGDNVPYYICKPGDRVYGWLATGNDISTGDFLESDGNGDLQALSTGEPVAMALEDLNNTSGSPSRIKVEIV